jgi:hypothetical protein
LDTVVTDKKEPDEQQAEQDAKDQQHPSVDPGAGTPKRFQRRGVEKKKG